MEVRVTPNLVVSRAVENAAQHRAVLANLQLQAATGSRLLKPSDDPEAMRTVLLEKARYARWDTELANLQDVRNRLNESVTELLDVQNILERARQIVLEGNQPIDAETGEALAVEVERLLERLVTVANTRFEDHFLFAGTAVTTAPFAVDTGDQASGATTVRYAGTDERTNTVVATDTYVASLYSGAEIFLHRSRGDTLVIGTTGAQPGSGTDTAIGRGTLQVRHTATTYAPGSGVQAGASSPTADSIIGPAAAHRLTIVDTSGTGAGGTISLNGGPVVAFTNSDTDLRVDGPNGEVVYVNTTAITAGFNGDVAITASGEMSVDGGETYTAIDFSGNQQLVHSLTGEVTNIDSSGIRSAGTDSLEYTGTADAFRALTELRDDLRNTRNLSAPDRREAFARRLDDLDRLRDNVLAIVGEQSVDLQNLEALEYKVQDLQVESQRVLSEKESADLGEVVLRLQNEQTLLQFAYASTAMIMQQSFLDFLG
jgi:flagellar hook-associated protein 3